MWGKISGLFWFAFPWWLMMLSISFFSFFLFFYYFFIYIANDFPFSGSPLPASPISPLPSPYSSIHSFPLPCSGIPLYSCTESFQNQGPLLYSFWTSFNLWIMSWVFKVSRLISTYQWVHTMNWSFETGLSHLVWCSPAPSICLRISWIHCFK